MNTVKIWDQLSDEFDTYKENLFQGVADNIYTIWPVILPYIKKNIKGNSLCALDYGCGTGMFCSKLKSLGFDTYGIDISPKMVEIAKKHLGKQIGFFVGDYKTALGISKKLGKFNLITAIMVFQFIPNLNRCIRYLSKSMANGSNIFIVLHNPKKLDERKIKNKLNLNGKVVAIYKRNSKEYDRVFKQFRFKKLLEKYPKTSKKFLQKYKQEDSTKIPKYMVLGYKKIS